MKTSTKQLITAAAEKMDLDQSSMTRIALQEYILTHCPDLMNG